MFCLVGFCSSGLPGSGIVAIAEREVGVREASHNAGPRVDEYNAYVGMKGVPWCASFVSWVHGKAGFKEPKTAWSPALFPKEREVGWLEKGMTKGLVMGIYFPELKRIAHCGIVTDVKGEYVYTVEGNTNLGGGREGVGVFRRMRHRRTIAKYADWIRPVPP